MAEAGEAPFGIYVHWPFCLAKCPYCDFNSHVRHRPVDATAFAEALVRELDHFATLSEGRTVTSVFFGGGTPSLMPPREVARVIERIAANWALAGDVEITLEANPTSAETDNFAGYRAAGVNRLSVGIQALDDASLKALGRRHTVAEGLAAWRMAAKIFQRTSFDLIYARPGQTMDGWREELARALGEGPRHMSLYQLTIEAGTPYAALHAAGALATLDDDLAADLYELTQELTAAAGLPAYEISNHARPGEQSRHNLCYWLYGDYAGVGPGAHSRLGPTDKRRSYITEKHPETWLTRVASEGSAVTESAILTGPEQASEMLLMGLRLNQGIDAQRYAELAGRSLDPMRIGELVNDGHVSIKANGRIAATAQGRRVLNAVIARLDEA